MTHPVMFEDDDPYLVRLREVALAFPDAVERVAHGRPGFRAGAGRFFAWYGGSTKAPGAERVVHDHALLVLPDDSERAALAEDPRAFAPAYLAPAGWTGLDLSAAGTVPPEAVDWREVAELLDASYRRVAGVRRTARLDAGEGPGAVREDVRRHRAGGTVAAKGP
ncbi:MmcQ/YjbR family DNA-binding protein [Streptomyces sp. NPDC060194]|uniref:MmcQ/YjbR family DNA-binding protein n=1 Tax=Streptomyces sp. NPDC060194 TaxID=3347069 RepID=UPI00366A2969